MPAPLLSAAAVAVWLNVNIETVYDLIAKRQLPAIKIGGQWRFQEAQVREWFEAHTAAHAPSKRRPLGSLNGGLAAGQAAPPRSTGSRSPRLRS
jgi:excisionase family DNA binding protein